MADEKSYHMTSEGFRKRGYEVIDWIADYMNQVEDLPVLSQAEPGSIRARLPDRFSPLLSRRRRALTCTGTRIRQAQPQGRRSQP